MATAAKKRGPARHKGLAYLSAAVIEPSDRYRPETFCLEKR